MPPSWNLRPRSSASELPPQRALTPGIANVPVRRFAFPVTHSRLSSPLLQQFGLREAFR